MFTYVYFIFRIEIINKSGSVYAKTKRRKQKQKQSYYKNTLFYFKCEIKNKQPFENMWSKYIKEIFYLCIACFWIKNSNFGRFVTMYFYILLKRGKVNLTDVYNVSVNYDIPNTHKNNLHMDQFRRRARCCVKRTL
jgi:hypothetical protein